jgi:hypothetical protein
VVMAAQDFHQMVYSIAASNAADRSVVAADGDCAAVASVTAITPMMVTVVVAIPVMVGPHSHAANGGINGHLGGSGNNGRGDGDNANRQQTKKNSAHGKTSLEVVKYLRLK